MRSTRAVRRQAAQDRVVGLLDNPQDQQLPHLLVGVGRLAGENFDETSRRASSRLCELLRRHEVRRSDLTVQHRAVVDLLRSAEVAQRHVVVQVAENVGVLDVAMHDLAVVQELQAFEYS